MQLAGNIILGLFIFLGLNRLGKMIIMAATILKSEQIKDKDLTEIIRNIK